jgi:hypothetical protein
MAKRKPSKNSETHMNEEWLDMHEGVETPLFWVDLDAQSQLAVVQDKLIRLEEKAAQLMAKPKSLIGKLRSRFLQ